jgi:hypothetical protein
MVERRGQSAASELVDERTQLGYSERRRMHSGKQRRGEGDFESDIPDDFFIFTDQDPTRRPVPSILIVFWLSMLTFVVLPASRRAIRGLTYSIGQRSY